MLKPKLDDIDENTKKVAKSLGVDLDEDVNKKDEKESDSSKKTDTDITDGDQGKKSDKPGDEDKQDYKKMYADSTKEFQTKYKPLEDKIGLLEKISGKKLDDILSDYQDTQNKDKKSKEGKKDPQEEVTKKFSSLEEKVEFLDKKIGDIEDKDKILVKQKIGSFREKYDMSEEDYESKIKPLLSGIKEMRKADGDPYDLEEGLEMAYLILNKDNINKIVEKKIQIKEKENSLNFSPRGSKETSAPKEEGGYTEVQKDIAQRMGTELTEGEK